LRETRDEKWLAVKNGERVLAFSKIVGTRVSSGTTWISVIILITIPCTPEINSICRNAPEADVPRDEINSICRIRRFIDRSRFQRSG